MTERAQPTDLELAALISSKICHDVIGPVGAIYNGLEILDEDDDAQAKTYALDVIRNVTEQASARLQFARFAFGAAGSAGAQIDLGTAEQISRGLLGKGKHKLAWRGMPGAHGQGQGQAAAQPDLRGHHRPAARRRDRRADRGQSWSSRISCCSAAVRARARRSISPTTWPAARPRRSMRCRSRPTTRGGWRPPRACALSIAKDGADICLIARSA